MKDDPQKIGYYQAIKELAELRKQNAAMREIVQALTDQETRYGDVKLDIVLCYNDSQGEYECPFCNGDPIRKNLTTIRFDHEADCPVTKARALLQEN